MNPIIQILTELNIGDDKISELFSALTENPMMAMAYISQLNIPAEKLQAIMSLVMAFMLIGNALRDALDVKN